MDFKKIENFLYYYPKLNNQSDDYLDFQTEISEKREFNELAAKKREKNPRKKKLLQTSIVDSSSYSVL